jgi:hypothetical protein
MVIKEWKKGNKKEEMRCVCMKAFREKDVITVVEGQTAYTNHNEVTA